MKIQEGYSYHVKDEFFENVDDEFLMKNHEDGQYRPHFFAIKDKNNDKIYWLIPISSKTEKYKGIIKKKTEKYGKCNTIIIGTFAEKEAAFLIQNAFPITEKYIDHIHSIRDIPVTLQPSLKKKLLKNFAEVMSFHKKGYKLFFANIGKIEQILKTDL